MAPASENIWVMTREYRRPRCHYHYNAGCISPSISIYNGRVMHIAKHTYYPLALVLSLGLMYSQVCNVICAFSNCSAPAPVKRAETVEHGGHCHQKQPASQKEQPPFHRDQPSDHQHRCPAHDSAASILPSETISTVVSYYAWQTPAAELVSSFDTPFNLAGNGADGAGRFRSPPRRPLFTILRI
jgi:hypothetical protein